jgi:hypothetical protein
MDAFQIAQLVLAFATELMKLIEAGVDHATALSRIRSIAADVTTIEADTERVAEGG